MGIVAYEPQDPPSFRGHSHEWYGLARTMNETRMRLAELLGGVSLASDLANGFPPGKVLRTVVLAVEVGRRAGIDASTLRDAYYTTLLRFLGCTGFAHEEAHEFGAGNDIAVRNVMAMADQ